jgi:hypothetical protein
MNTPITWGDYISIRLLIWASSTALLLLGAIIVAIWQHHEDMHVNDEPDEKGPGAGKILGL